MKWEKVLANQISDKDLVSRMYKQQQKDNLIKRWAKDLNIHLSKIFKWPTSTRTSLVIRKCLSKPQ